MNKITNDFRQIWNFAYMIYVKETFNPMVSSKKILFTWKLSNDIIVIKITSV